MERTKLLEGYRVVCESNFHIYMTGWLLAYYTIRYALVIHRARVKYGTFTTCAGTA